MTRDLSSIVDAELDATAPPSPISGPALAAAGRRSIRRRRLGGAVAFVAGLAAVTVAAAGLTGGGASLRPEPAAPPDPQPSFGLPELDPAKTYAWRYFSTTTTPETERLTTALWAGLSAVDGLDVVLDDDGEKRPVTGADEFPPIVRADSELVEVLGEAVGREGHLNGAPTATTGHSEPIYQTPDDVVVGLTRDGRSVPDELDLRVLPEGGHLGRHAPDVGDDRGPVVSAPYVEPACQDYAHPDVDPGYRFTVSYDCEETVLGTGERALLAETRTVWADGPAMRLFTVVIYTAEGNALVLRVGGLATPDPVLSLEQLAAIAANLPRVPVI